MTIPRSLRVVAYLEIGFGILAALEIAWAVLEARVSLNFGVVGLWMGPGLLRLSESWRYVAVRLNLLGVTLLIIVASLVVLFPAPAGLVVLGRPAGAISPWSMFTALVGLALVGCWKAWVLARPDIRALFSSATVDAEQAAPYAAI